MNEIQVKAGKWKRRNGSVTEVRPRMGVTYSEFRWIDNDISPNTYRDNGTAGCYGRQSDYDLIEYVPDEPTQPEQGDGWRLLEKGELVQEGDLFWCKSTLSWRPTNNHNNYKAGVQDYGLTYRRRITQPEPAKAELVPGRFYKHGDRLVFYIGKNQFGDCVFNERGKNWSLFAGEHTQFIDSLEPYTPPHEPRTWTMDVIHVTDETSHEIDLIRQVGQKIFLPWKELGRTTVTIKERVTQCPTK